MIGTEKLTYAQYKAKKTRREITYPLVTDDDTVVVYRLAEERLRKARLRTDPAELAAAQAAVEEAEKAIRDCTLLYRLRALPRKGDGSWQALVADNPPTRERLEEYRKEVDNPKATLRWNGETFGPALVAACLIEPEVTVEQAQEMATDWNEAEWDGLFAAAIQLNETATDTAGLVFS